MLVRLGEVKCPNCIQKVWVWAEPGEVVARSTAPKCPDCKTPLYDQIVGLLRERSQAKSVAQE
jgi:uncharacterized Zn finger protein (UPF0148 family)